LKSRSWLGICTKMWVV